MLNWNTKTEEDQRKLPTHFRMLQNRVFDWSDFVAEFSSLCLFFIWSYNFFIEKDREHVFTWIYGTWKFARRSFAWWNVIWLKQLSNETHTWRNPHPFIIYERSAWFVVFYNTIPKTHILHTIFCDENKRRQKEVESEKKELRNIIDKTTRHPHFFTTTVAAFGNWIFSTCKSFRWKNVFLSIQFILRSIYDYIKLLKVKKNFCNAIFSAH